MNQILQSKNTTIKVGIQTYVFDCLIPIYASYSGRVQLCIYSSYELAIYFLTVNILIQCATKLKQFWS